MSTLVFDLSAYATYYEQTYQTDGGLIRTNYGLYAFGELSCDERIQVVERQEASFGEVFGACETDSDCELRTRTLGCGDSLCIFIADNRYGTVSNYGTENANRYLCDGSDVVDCPMPEGVLACDESPPSVACVDGLCVRSD